MKHRIAFWALLMTAVALAAPLGLWLYHPTTAYLKPVSLIYEKRDGVWWATFIRETPRGRVFAEWVTEIQLVGTALECSASGISPYDPKHDNTVEYIVPARLVPCLDAKGIKTITHQHTVILGPISLVPTQLEYVTGYSEPVDRVTK